MATPTSSSDIATQNHKGKDPEGEPASTQPADSVSSDTPAATNLASPSTTTDVEQQQPAPEDVPNGRAEPPSLQPPLPVEEGQAPSPSTHANQPPPLPPVTDDSTTPSQNVSHPPPPSPNDGKATSDDSKDAEKDKASLNTTLTGTVTHAQTQSARRKEEAKSVSDHDAPDATTSTEVKGSIPIPKSSSKKKRKPTIFSKILQLVPCIGPSKTHDMELTSPVAGPSTIGGNDVNVQPKEKQTEVVTSKPVEEPAVSAEPPVEQPTTATLAAEDMEDATRQLTPIEVPAPTDDPAVVVPPTPTKSTLPPDETNGMTSAAVVPPGATKEDVHEMQRHHGQHRTESENGSDESSSFTEEDDLDDGTPMDEIEDEEERLILQGGAGIPIGPDGLPRPLLPPVSPKHAGRKCLVLDLDETLVHSSFKSISQADYVVPVEIEYHWHNVYVIKRPGVDNFLKKMGEIYEVVVFTASLSKYADPVLDKLDIHHVVSHRLFRESCYNHRGNYVKDLSQLGRPISDTIIIDNSPASYIFHPNNAVPVSSWFTDPHDQELNDLCPFLTDLATVDDVRGVLDGGL